MKAWRFPVPQRAWAASLDPEVQARLPRRLGRLFKAQQVRILPGPSFLLQQLLIRSGLMQGA